MTEVSFYHLQAQPLEQTLPRLLDKVSERGLKALVRMKTDQLKADLDKVLWTFAPTSFLAHSTNEDKQADLQPVLLTTESTDNPNGSTVVVLLEDSDANDIANFDRCLYMFDGNDPDSLQAARARWKNLKAEGLELTYWQQENGRWTKKA